MSGRQHLETGAGVTVAALRVPIEQADQFGVIETAADSRRIRAFLEKPSEPPPGLPDAPDRIFASIKSVPIRGQANRRECPGSDRRMAGHGAGDPVTRDRRRFCLLGSLVLAARGEALDQDVGEARPVRMTANSSLAKSIARSIFSSASKSVSSITAFLLRARAQR